MALFPTKPSCHFLFLLILVLLSFTQVIAAGRQVSALADKKLQIEGNDGTIVIPDIGRYIFGSYPQLPNFGDLDHSGPAAANRQYMPGNDDTFYPNPGFETPNPNYGGRKP